MAPRSPTSAARRPTRATRASTRQVAFFVLLAHMLIAVTAWEVFVGLYLDLTQTAWCALIGGLVLLPFARFDDRLRRRGYLAFFLVLTLLYLAPTSRRESFTWDVGRLSVGMTAVDVEQIMSDHRTGARYGIFATNGIPISRAKARRTSSRGGGTTVSITSAA